MINVKKINKFNRLNFDEFNLSIALVKDEFNYNIIGILKKNNKIIDYCETINIYDRILVNKTYNIIINNRVCPCHFYNIIDDI